MKGVPAMVYVLNQDGQPLMPTENHTKVRVFLKRGNNYELSKNQY